LLHNLSQTGSYPLLFLILCSISYPTVITTGIYSFSHGNFMFVKYESTLLATFISLNSKKNKSTYQLYLYFYLLTGSYLLLLMATLSTGSLISADWYSTFIYFQYCFWSIVLNLYEFPHQLTIEDIFPLDQLLEINVQLFSSFLNLGLLLQFAEPLARKTR